MMEGLGEDVNRFAHIYADAHAAGLQPEKNILPKDLTPTLAAGCNVKLRRRIFDRWIEF